MELEKAVDHPVRIAIIRLFLEASERLTPGRASRTLDLPLPIVSYHFKVLTASGLIDLADTKPVEGTIEHIYVAGSSIDDPVVREALAAAKDQP